MVLSSNFNLIIHNPFLNTGFSRGPEEIWNFSLDRGITTWKSVYALKLTILSSSFLGSLSGFFTPFIIKIVWLSSIFFSTSHFALPGISNLISNVFLFSSDLK